MINEASIAKMKKGVRLVNCARGELVNEADLAQGLKTKHVAAAALDVFVEEPLKNSPLTSLENVILTPHVGGSTFEAQEAVGVQIAQQVKEYLKHGVIQNAVNVPSVSAEEYATMQPYIVLAERMGGFLAQVSEGSIEEISIRYGGHIAEWKTELIRNGVIKGILNEALEEKANLVNAATIAEERGLRVLESHKPKSSTGGAGSVLSIFLKSSAEEHMVKGAVLHGDAPRLLHVDGIDVEAPLERNLIFLRNRDVPGVIGKVGTILGEESINIADFSLGRRAEKDSDQPREAIAVVHVDGSVTDQVLAKLRTIPAVQKAKAVRLF
jgi:D-3-phosphoglycerate dehydrogenase